jgi:multisubunit Na+/H+ antiporter MnhB subunit
MKSTVRAASNADGLVSEMRQLAQTAATAPADIDQEPAQLERTISRQIATFLMVLLVTIIFATSAVPDVGPGLARVIQVHL